MAPADVCEPRAIELDARAWLAESCGACVTRFDAESAPELLQQGLVRKPRYIRARGRFRHAPAECLPLDGQQVLLERLGEESTARQTASTRFPVRLRDELRRQCDADANERQRSLIL